MKVRGRADARAGRCGGVWAFGRACLSHLDRHCCCCCCYRYRRCCRGRHIVVAIADADAAVGVGVAVAVLLRSLSQLTSPLLGGRA
jgi:hypothetical protein